MNKSKESKETKAANEEQIIRCIKLGMDLHTAMYTIGATDEEMEVLEKDEKFMRRVEVTKSILELNLLEDHQDAMNLQLAQGKTAAVQWKLEHVNPARWGRGNGDDGGSDIPGVVIVEIPGLEDYLNRGDRIGNDLKEEEDADGE